jgi:hypothetical protein
MPSLLHEGLVNLFRNRPALGPELLREVLHAPLPAFENVRVADANLTEVVPAERRADLVLLLETDAPRAALVVEVQLSVDPDKAWSWPVYLASLRARLRCGVTLLVVTTDETVARWAARPIAMGHPGLALTPLVVGPTSVPLVRDESEAERDPELAVLSALAHGHGPEAAEVATVALTAAGRLDDDRAALYVDLVLAHVGVGARVFLEGLMASRNYEYQSDFAKRYFGQGRAEGQAEGRAEALLRILAARGLEIAADARERILSCRDLSLLDTWLTRAVTAHSASEVLGED